MKLNKAWDRYDPLIKKKVLEQLHAVQLFETYIPAVVTIHDANDVSLLYMSHLGTENLGVSLDDITLSFHEYHARFFNLEDANDYVPKVTGLLKRNNTNEIVTYFQQVRRSPKHPWSWHLSATKIWMRNQENQPLFFITISLPIDAKSHVNRKVERLLRENEYLREHHHLYNILTRREREIVQYLAQGHATKTISQKTFLSEQTINTHKRNIRNKLGIHSAAELVKFAQAFDLI
jgi:DNA-binding CsgD family transcriptional regulator